MSWAKPSGGVSAPTVILMTVAVAPSVAWAMFDPKAFCVELNSFFDKESLGLVSYVDRGGALPVRLGDAAPMCDLRAAADAWHRFYQCHQLRCLLDQCLVGGSATAFQFFFQDLRMALRLWLLLQLFERFRYVSMMFVLLGNGIAQCCIAVRDGLLGGVFRPVEGSST